MAFPLQKTIYTTAFVVTLVLGVLLSLGVRQYQLYKDQEKVTAQSEALFFQFAIIREQVTESLIEGRFNSLAGVTDELEDLNANLSRILANKNIDEEYKLSIVNSIDLPGIILLLRKIASGPVEQESLRQLNSSIRTLGERLMLFDRVLVNYAKRKLISFQNIVIGALAIVVFIILNILLYFHRQAVTPLISLVRQVKEATGGTRNNILLPAKNIAREVRELADAFHNQLLARLKSLEGVARRNRILYAVHRAGVAIRRASSKEELFKEVSRALIFNEDYCMVWIGEPDEEGRDLMPVMADGIATLNDKRGEACMALLLTEARERGEKNDPALRALLAGKPVVDRDILADIPKGHLKDTPLAEGKANCVALPLIWEHTTYGVLNIYSGREDSFNDEEMKLLDKMSSDVGFALYFLDVKRELQIERTVNETLTEAEKAMTLTLNPSGEIVSFNAGAEKVCGYGRQEVLGKKWCDILLPEEKRPAVREKFLAFAKGPEAELAEEIAVADKNHEPKVLRCIFLKSAAQEGKIFCIGLDITGRDRPSKKIAAVQVSKLTSLGELTIDVAHEINDLCNGIINYAQVLADETKDETGQTDKIVLLDKIINEGERISGIAQKLLYYGRGEDRIVEPTKLSDVEAESLTLVKHQFRNDGIQVHVDFKDDPQIIPVNVQHLQHVFLNILSNARYALNQRYAHKDDNKALEIQAEMVHVDGAQWLRTSVTDRGEGIDPHDIEKVFDPDFTTKPPGEGTGFGLSICRELVEEYAGRISIESQMGDYTTVNVDLPLAQ